MPIVDLPSTIIQNNGFFDPDALSDAIRDWYLSNKYFVELPSYKFEILETGKKYDQEWTAKKKVTEYVRFHVNVTVRVHDMNEVEIIKDGQKIKTTEGKVFILVAPKLELDWQKRFEDKKSKTKDKFLKWLDKFFRQHIIKYKIGDYWEDMALAEGGSMAGAVRAALEAEVR